MFQTLTISIDELHILLKKSQTFLLTIDLVTRPLLSSSPVSLPWPWSSLWEVSTLLKPLQEEASPDLSDSRATFLFFGPLLSMSPL